MKELLDKLTSYNIFNYLLPGVLFAVIGDGLTSYTLLQADIVLGVFVYYFYGLIISRLGSLLIEPFLKRIKVLQFEPYADFMRASKTDAKIELLSEANNMYRTLLSTFVCLLLLQLLEFLQKTYAVVSQYGTTTVIILLVFLFAFSYRKQTKYISARVKQAILSEESKPADKEENAAPKAL